MFLTSLKTRVLESFDDPALNSADWNRLLEEGGTDTVFLTREWQRTWWELFGRGQLLLVAAEQGGRIVALAPLFAECGMIFFVGSEGSDYLDFLGDTSDPEVLAAILETAQSCVPDFLGFKFYNVPDESKTGKQLQAAADRMGLVLYHEASFDSPCINLKEGGSAGREAAERKSLVRHERFFRREGKAAVTHFTESNKIIGLST